MQEAQNKFEESKKCKLLSFSILFAIIFVSKDTLLFGTNANSLFDIAHYMIIFCICITLCFIIIWHQISFKPVVFAIFYFLLFANIFSLLVNEDFNSKYIYEMIIILVATFYVVVYSKSVFIVYFVEIITFLAFFSMIVWGINIVNPQVLRMFPNLTNTGGFRFKWCIFSNVCVTRSHGFDGYLRNFGIFREPGVYQIFLNIAILFVLFCGEKLKRKKTKLVMLVLTILTTFSTAGIIITSLLLLIYCIANLKCINIKNILSSLAFIAGLIAVIFLFNRYFMVFDKLFSKIGNEDDSSWFSRTSSFVVNIAVGFNNIFFGAGWDNVKVETAKYTSLLYNMSFKFSNTNTFLKLFAIHGLGVFVFYIVELYKFFKQKRNDLLSIALFLIMFLCFCNEDMSLNIVTYLLIFYGFYEDRRGVVNDYCAIECRGLWQYRQDC